MFLYILLILFHYFQYSYPTRLFKRLLFTSQPKMIIKPRDNIKSNYATINCIVNKRADKNRHINKGAIPTDLPHKFLFYEDPICNDR